MNEKLNIQNLIELLAEKHGMDKADAESFVKEFFQLIEESLENDKYCRQHQSAVAAAVVFHGFVT